MISEFLEDYRKIPVIDVRSPGEYQYGHIPGAISLPLFTDDERAVVGKAYHMQGREEAVKEGLKVVGPKMQDFVNTALTHAPDKKVMVYCWRGGMRSSSMGFLMETAGMKAKVLEGGYKSYRRHVLQHFAQPYKFVILGGMTGSGKTDILQVLKQKGEQVIDLEGMASHKGSAFGHLGVAAQPSTEHFENLLYEALQQLNPMKYCWLEDESLKIGKISLPMGFYLQMRAATVVRVKMPRNLRAERLVHEYPDDTSGLKEAVSGIFKRLGHRKKGEILDYLDEGNLFEAAMGLLEYYDKSYTYGQSKRNISTIINVETDTPDPVLNANKVLEIFNTHF